MSGLTLSAASFSQKLDVWWLNPQSHPPPRVFRCRSLSKTRTYIFSMHSRDCCVTPSPQDRLQLLNSDHFPQDFLIVTLFDLYFMCSDMNLLISKSFGLFSVEVLFALISFLEFSDLAEIFRLPFELAFVSTSADVLLPICSNDWLSKWVVTTSNAASCCFPLFSLASFAFVALESTASLDGIVILGCLLLLSLSKSVALLPAKTDSPLLLIVS